MTKSQNNKIVIEIELLLKNSSSIFLNLSVKKDTTEMFHVKHICCVFLSL